MTKLEGIIESESRRSITESNLSLEGRALSRPNKSARTTQRPFLQDMEKIGRKHPVHQPVRERHNTAIIVFLTVCTKNRKPILANPAAHETLREAWYVARSWMTGRYILMPDHIHLFCAPGELIAQPLMTWVKYWKSNAARRWPHPGDAPICQRHFWDTQLRRGENYDAKWDYVVENPVRAGLVSRSEDWPYQGELNLLRW
jgi:putative transposase